MKIIHSLEEMNIKEPIVFAIGFFDGIHKGHQEILNQTKKACSKKIRKIRNYNFLSSSLVSYIS